MKGNSALIFLLVVLVLVGAGAYFLFRKTATGTNTAGNDQGSTGTSSGSTSFLSLKDFLYKPASLLGNQTSAQALYNYRQTYGSSY